MRIQIPITDGNSIFYFKDTKLWTSVPARLRRIKHQGNPRQASRVTTSHIFICAITHSPNLEKFGTQPNKAVPFLLLPVPFSFFLPTFCAFFPNFLCLSFLIVHPLHPPLSMPSPPPPKFRAFFPTISALTCQEEAIL